MMGGVPDYLRDGTVPVHRLDGGISVVSHRFSNDPISIMTVSYVSRISRAVFTMALFALLVAPAAQAQISADRPGFSNSAATVAPGTFQAELGYDLTQNTSGSETFSTHSLGLLVLRYGVTDKLEVRANVGSIGFAERLSNSSETEFESGYFGSSLDGLVTGPSVEVKARLFQSSTTTLTAFSQTSLPMLMSGAFETPDDRARQTLALLLDGALGENVSLTVNGGATFFWAAGVQEDRLPSALFIPTLNFSINEQVGAYVGYFGQYWEFANTNLVEGGFTFLAHDDTQLDLNFGYRIDDNGDGYFLGLGLAQRF